MLFRSVPTARSFGEREQAIRSESSRSRAGEQRISAVAEEKAVSQVIAGRTHHGVAHRPLLSSRGEMVSAPQSLPPFHPRQLTRPRSRSILCSLYPSIFSPCRSLHRTQPHSLLSHLPQPPATRPPPIALRSFPSCSSISKSFHIHRRSEEHTSELQSQ